MPSVPVITCVAFVSMSVSAQPYEAVLHATVESGDFDGLDLAGASFTFRTLVTDPTDRHADVEIGSFLGAEASFDFGALGTFHADANDIALVVYRLEAPVQAGAGFTTDASGLSDSLGYSILFEPLTFDPNDLATEPRMSAFHIANFGAAFTTTNGAGQTLTIGRLSMPETGSFATRAVPAPGILGVLCLGASGRRRRPG
ncbi:MAG: hypothetical protein KDA28_11035 [Phycisphaerales bacterium]|nr:hypothetical protein [Phycisphaerales bacterium]